MAKTPHISELTLELMFPEKYLKAAHLQGTTPTVTIERIRIEEVPMSGGKKASATVMNFQKTEKQFICNKTNGFAIALLLGSVRPVEWIGKRIQLTSDVEDDRQNRCEMICLRVLGSPDASPASTAAYQQCWRGQRKGGFLCARLKMAIGRMQAAAAPTTAFEEPTMSAPPTAIEKPATLMREPGEEP